MDQVGTVAGTPRAIVLLGCRPIWRRGELSGAAARRVGAAAQAAMQDPAALVVVSGGKAWDGVVEADAMLDALVRHGIVRARLLPERCSYCTRDNARFTAVLLRRIGVPTARVVTCDWHVPRAVALFRTEGIPVSPIPVPGPKATALTRLWRWGRERVARRMDGVA
jgi:uncharacterized SAM-binding protein YcdF (DUF218 family)